MPHHPVGLVGVPTACGCLGKGKHARTCVCVWWWGGVGGRGQATQDATCEGRVEELLYSQFQERLQ